MLAYAVVHARVSGGAGDWTLIAIAAHMLGATVTEHRDGSSTVT
jgi:hypothetical protein